METVNGPFAPQTAGGMIYQVTLSSGLIVTSPTMFGEVEPNSIAPEVIVTNDGRVLIGKRLENVASPGVDGAKPCKTA